MRILCNHQKDKTIYIYIQSLFFISRISLFHCSILLGVTLFSGFVLILWEIELGIYWTIYITILVGVYFSFRDIWLFTEVHFWRCWMRIFIGSSKQPSKCKMDVCRYVCIYIYVILICDIWIDYNDVSATLQSMNFRIGAIIPFFFAYYFRLAFDIIQIHAGHSLKHCVFAYMASELYRRRSKVTSSKQNWKYLLNDQICIYIYVYI